MQLSVRHYACWLLVAVVGVQKIKSCRGRKSDVHELLLGFITKKKKRNTHEVMEKGVEKDSNME